MGGASESRWTHVASWKLARLGGSLRHLMLFPKRSERSTDALVPIGDGIASTAAGRLVPGALGASRTLKSRDSRACPRWTSACRVTRHTCRPLAAPRV